VTRRNVLSAGVAFLALAAMGAYAQSATTSAFGPNEGEVMEVDFAAGEIMLRHGPLPELDMPPMSMVFKVADTSFLRKVRKGERVRFKAGLVDGRFGVVAIEKLKSESRR